MVQTEDNYIKILHRFYSNVLEEETVETMWATIFDKHKGLYKLDSIPFYARSLAIGDIIKAVYDEDEQALTIEDVIEYSGHSTVQVVIMNPSIQTEGIRAIFHGFKCFTEKQIDRYFAMDIPAEINYEPIKQKLIDLQAKGTIDYGEACLSEKHRIEIEQL